VAALQPAFREEARVRVCHHGPADAEGGRQVAAGRQPVSGAQRAAGDGRLELGGYLGGERRRGRAVHHDRQAGRQSGHRNFSMIGSLCQSNYRLGYGTMSSETTPLSSTSRTTLRRHRERGQTDRAALYEVLDAGLICHLGVVSDGTPVVLPTAYGRDGDTLYLHGSSANGAFWAADGQRICVTVTHMDGLVAARSVFSHSVNYRSAVIFGTATVVTDDDERRQALRLITDHLIPGRWAAARQPTTKEMAATAVLSLPLTEASVKVRTGMPADEPEDYELDVWAGVLPISVTFGSPVPDPQLRAEMPVPAHIRDRAS
jgi:nitroimidazol reductase NimA-like FMN-containing flavoprotein (pyridoxamine 5'-phosphate oxidase superfamily)